MRARWIEKAMYGLGILIAGHTSLRGQSGQHAGDRRELDVGGTWPSCIRRDDRSIAHSVEVGRQLSVNC